MSWSERQQTMLREMGLRVWARASTAVVSEAAPQAAQQTVPLAQPRVAAAPAGPAAQAPQPAQARGLSAPAVPARAAAPAGASAPEARASAQRSAVDTRSLDWPALAQAVANCSACALCEARKQTVLGSGPTTAHWLVVVGAPSEAEELQGQSAVGPEGELLDRMLAALALSRAVEGSDLPPQRRVHVTNAVKCRPPSNRNVLPDEVATCGAYLQRQIELLQPRVILALGPLAVKALLGSDEPLGRLRGQVHRAHGVPVVVSYNPAYLLRHATAKAGAWADLCLAADTAQAPAPPERPGAGTGSSAV
jgi:uracil-DNA glycosylase